MSRNPEFSLFIIATVLILCVIIFAVIRENHKESFAKALEVIKRKKIIILVSSLLILITVIISILAVNNSKKQTAIEEIEEQIEAVIYKAYEGEYAQEYGLKNIEFTVDDVGKYLSGRYACITITCETEKFAYQGYKEYLCKEILRVLPTSVSTSTYGDVAITSIIYTPKNDNINYGVAIYLNGEQILKHNKTFDELIEESIAHERFEEEREAESEFRIHSQYYELKDYFDD